MANRPWTNLDSSNLKMIALENGTLKVRFVGGTEYHYQGVSESTFDEIAGAASSGRTFNQLIKSNPVDYPFHRAD